MAQRNYNFPLLLSLQPDDISNLDELINRIHCLEYERSNTSGSKDIVIVQ